MNTINRSYKQRLNRLGQNALNGVVDLLYLLSRSILVSTMMLIVTFAFIIDANMLNGLATITEEELTHVKLFIFEQWLLMILTMAALGGVFRGWRHMRNVEHSTVWEYGNCRVANSSKQSELKCNVETADGHNGSSKGKSNI